MSWCLRGGRVVYTARYPEPHAWEGVEAHEPLPTPKPRGNPVFRLRVEFEGGEKAWEYPIALNGRVPARFFAEGVELAPVRECVFTRTYEGYPNNDYTCSACGKTYTAERSSECCPRCGARRTATVDADGTPLLHDGATCVKDRTAR